MPGTCNLEEKKYKCDHCDFEGSSNYYLRAHKKETGHKRTYVKRNMDIDNGKFQISKKMKIVKINLVCSSEKNVELKRTT